MVFIKGVYFFELIVFILLLYLISCFISLIDEYLVVMCSFVCLCGLVLFNLFLNLNNNLVMVRLVCLLLRNE